MKLKSQVVSSKLSKFGLSQELSFSRISESTTDQRSHTQTTRPLHEAESSHSDTITFYTIDNNTILFCDNNKILFCVQKYKMNARINTLKIPNKLYFLFALFTKSWMLAREPGDRVLSGLYPLTCPAWLDLQGADVPMTGTAGLGHFCHVDRWDIWWVLQRICCTWQDDNTETWLCPFQHSDTLCTPVCCSVMMHLQCTLFLYHTSVNRAIYVMNVNVINTLVASIKILSIKWQHTYLKYTCCPVITA